jgi:polar amino acid transport system substrate-binding protein
MKMNLKKISQSFLILILFTFICIPIHAQNRLNKILEKGEIVIGMSGNQPPFSMKAKGGDLIGYEVDIAKLLSQSMNVKLKIEQIPFPDLLQALKEGKVDLVMSGMTMTPKRNLEAAFVGPYILSGKSILTKSSILAKASNSEEINQANLKLATLKGSTSEDFVNNFLTNTDLSLVNNYDEAVKLLSDDQVDAVVADYPICILTMARYPDAGFATLNQPITLEPIGMALPPDDVLLLNMIQNYFSAMQLAGLLEGLEQYWFEDGSWLIQVE